MMNQFSAGIALFLGTALVLTGCGQSGNLVLPQKTGQNSADSGYAAPATPAAP